MIGVARTQPTLTGQWMTPVVAAGLGGACGLLVAQSWWLGVVLLVVLIGSAAALQSPLACWMGAMSYYYFIAHHLPTGISSLITWGLLVLFLASCWCEQADAGEPFELGDKHLWLAIVGWGLWVIPATLHSSDYGISAREVGRYGLSFLGLLTHLNWLRGETTVRRVIGWLQGIALTLACFSVVQHVGGLLLGSPDGLWFGSGSVDEPSVASVGGSRIVAPLSTTNKDLAVLFEAILPVSVSLLVASGTPRSWRGWASIGLMLAGLVWTQEQSPLLSALFGIGIVLLIRLSAPRRRLLLWLAIGSVAAMVIALWLIEPLAARAHYELSGRDLVWAAALKAIREHPVLGIGPGCWSEWFQAHFITADFFLRDMKGNSFFLSPASLGGEAHSLFLTKAAEMGVLSGLGLIGILGCWFRAAIRATRRITAGWPHALATGCLASMAGLVFQSLFENGPIIGKARGAEIMIVWLVAALPFVLSRTTRLEAGSVSAAAQPDPKC